MQHNQNTGHLLLLTSPALLSRSLLYSSLWCHPRAHLPLVSATSHKQHVLRTRTITIGQCCGHLVSKSFPTCALRRVDLARQAGQSVLATPKLLRRRSRHHIPQWVVANTYCTETTGLGLSRCCLGRTAASKHLYDCCLTVAGAISSYLRQTDLLHSLLILCSIGSPYFLFTSFLSRGGIPVRFLVLIS